ncbi:trimeric autotransporter adhesin [Sphingomonas faeni]|uniref:Trimeric autotransporter adhesin n=1 Tax=Sphingomonas faeni TaxID=185950 RepID=A0A2T5TVY1_9SPHN|nr:trimeric autotransporter adhesin [Sphingomonas faeni]
MTTERHNVATISQQNRLARRSTALDKARGKQANKQSSANLANASPLRLNSMAAALPAGGPGGRAEIISKALYANLPVAAMLAVGALGIGLMYPTTAGANTYNSTGACNSGADTGPDGIPRPAETNPVDGDGTYSSVLGCSANGGAKFGVTALGAYSSATGDGGVAVGYGASASTRATATGLSAIASGSNSVAIGGRDIVAQGGATTPVAVAGATASGIRAVAVGSGSRAAASSAIAIGDSATASSTNNIAIGTGASATNAAVNFNAVAIGENSTSTGGTALGSASRAVEASTALGSGAKATVQNSIAIGVRDDFQTIASGDGSIAVGNAATATGLTSIAIGRQSTSAANGAIALGQSANASGIGALALGGATGGFLSPGASQATGAYSVALGGGDGSTVGGVVQSGARAAGANSVAIGTASVANSQSSTAVGYNNQVTGARSGAFGTGNVVTGTASYAVGDPNIINGDGTFVTGNDNTVNGPNTAGNGNRINVHGSNNILASTANASGSAVFGNTNTVNAQNAIVAGNGSTVTAAGGIVVGGGSSATAANALALGNAATASGTNGAAIGLNAVASGTSSAALGLTATASGANALAFGNNAQASGGGATAIGQNTNASAQAAVAIGTLARSSGLLGLAIGSGSIVTGDYGIAIGSDAQAPGTFGVAIGNTARALYDNSLALGAGSRTGTAAPTGVGYATGAAAPTSEVSIGRAGAERRITNVSAGAAATDAVNVSQLTGVQNQFAGVIGGTVNPDGTYTGPTYATTGGTTATTVQGAFDNYNTAITNTAAVANRGFDVTTAQTGTGTVTGTAIANVAPGARQTITAGNNIAIAQNGTDLTIATNPNLVADSLTTGGTVINTAGFTNGASTLGATGLTIAGGPSVTTAGINAGNQVIANVAAGVATTDAVNLGQLQAIGAVADNSVQYDDAAKTRTTLAGVASTDGGVTGGTTIGNLHQGELSATSTEAVNGAQLFATNQQVATNTGAIAGNTTAITNLGNSIASGTIGPVQQSGTANRLALVAPGSTGAAPGALQTLGNLAAGTAATDAVNVSQLRGVQGQFAGVIGGTVNPDGTYTGPTYTTAGGTTATTVQGAFDNYNTAITNAAATANRGFDITTARTGTGTVTGTAVANVAPGTRQTITAGNNISISQSGTDLTIATNPNLVADSLTTGGTVINAAGLTIAGGPSLTTTGINAGGKTVTNVAAGSIAAGSTDAVNGSQLAATNSSISALTTIVGGSTIGAVQRPGTGDRLNLVAAGASGAAPGAAQTLANVAAGLLAAGSTEAVNGGQLAATNLALATLGQSAVQYDDATRTGVTLNSGGSPVALRNVAAGTLATDAVNVGQLGSGLASTLAAANEYTDVRINAVNFDLQTYKRDANAGTAGALASAALPQAFEPGKSLVAGGVGTYRGQAAFAVGVSRIFDDGHTILKAGVNRDTRGNSGANAGIGYQF